MKPFRPFCCAALIALFTVPAAFAAGMKTMDANADGEVTAAEHEAGARALFVAMDLNRDGSVTVAEMDAFHDVQLRAEGKASEIGAPKPMSSADKIATIDGNGDGVLSADEHAAGSRTMFGKMDSDGNFKLDADEWEKGHARLLSAAPPRPGN